MKKERQYYDKEEYSKVKEIGVILFVTLSVYLEIAFLISLILSRILNYTINIEQLLSISTTVTFVAISLVSLILGKMDDTILGKTLREYLYENTNYFYSIYIAIILFISISIYFNFFYGYSCYHILYLQNN